MQLAATDRLREDQCRIVMHADIPMDIDAITRVIWDTANLTAVIQLLQFLAPDAAWRVRYPTAFKFLRILIGRHRRLRRFQFVGVQYVRLARLKHPARPIFRVASRLPVIMEQIVTARGAYKSATAFAV